MNANSMRSAEATRPVHSITADVAAVRGEVDALEKQLDELEVKLGPVLRPATENGDRVDVPRAVRNRSSVGNELESLGDRVSAAVARLGRLTRAAEIA